MPVEPPGRISETPIVKRGEHATSQQKKKQPRKEEPKPRPEKTGKIDIKI
jgi:hypothetical protein